VIAACFVVAGLGGCGTTDGSEVEVERPGGDRVVKPERTSVPPAAVAKPPDFGPPEARDQEPWPETLEPQSTVPESQLTR